jgi:hypothetical protein
MSQRIVCALAVAIVVGGLAACASVDVIPLTVQGQKATDQEPGVRYYLPAPYLLVAELPPTPTGAKDKSKPGDQPGDIPPDEKGLTESHAGAAPKPGSPKDGGADSGTSGPGANNASAPVSDTSFQAGTPQYMMKLIYLPDRAHPMAMTAHSGLFGTAAMKPTLQDGWMLTALDSSADNKVAEVLTAVGSIIGAASGAGGAKASGGKPPSAEASFGADGKPLPKPSLPILRPGLYRFDYDTGTGVLKGLVPVTLFGRCDELPPPPDGKGAVPCLKEIPLGIE